MSQCRRPGCEGSYEDMGGGEIYCDNCGLAPVVSPMGSPLCRRHPERGRELGEGMLSSPPTGMAVGGRGGKGGDSSSARSGSHASSRSSSRSSRSSTSRRSVSGRLSRSLSGTSTSARSVSVRSSGTPSGSSGRNRLGAGLVSVPDVPRPDPQSAVMSEPEVPERKRFCSRSDCGAPVGRSRGDRKGRTEGFCTKCGHPYSFVPKLGAGDIVHGQYEVVGCLAHGGLGWVYLAVDRAVSDRWVVLKGLLDTGDQDAMAAAISERRFLAEIEHSNIVRIYNFVEHLDQRTGSMDGYIVMEYVGGKSLKEIANERRGPAGRRDPLPVEQACAYGIEALEALGHLHSRNLLYCDFKVDNAIQQQDQLKLIDMGAVRRMDDDESAIYGTVGYQAPEVAEVGPSVASDLYTVARTLAVLTFDFQGYTNVFVDSLPDPGHIDVFQRYESFYRLLVRATDPDPARRFASATEMAEQLTGVLREVVALQTGRPRPALSTLFGPELRVPDTQLFAELTGDVSQLGGRVVPTGRRARRGAARAALGGGGGGGGDALVGAGGGAGTGRVPAPVGAGAGGGAAPLGAGAGSGAAPLGPGTGGVPAQGARGWPLPGAVEGYAVTGAPGHGGHAGAAPLGGAGGVAPGPGGYAGAAAVPAQSAGGGPQAGTPGYGGPTGAVPLVATDPGGAGSYGPAGSEAHGATHRSASSAAPGSGVHPTPTPPPGPPQAPGAQPTAYATPGSQHGPHAGPSEQPGSITAPGPQPGTYAPPGPAPGSHATPGTNAGGAGSGAQPSSYAAPSPQPGTYAAPDTHIAGPGAHPGTSTGPGTHTGGTGPGAQPSTNTGTSAQPGSHATPGAQPGTSAGPGPQPSTHTGGTGPGAQHGNYAGPGAPPGSYATPGAHATSAHAGFAHPATQAAVPAPVTVPGGVAPPGAAPGVGAGGVPVVSGYLAPLKAGATALALPVPRVDPGDPNAGFLAGLLASAPAELIAALQSAPADSVERRLRELRARLEMDERATAAEALYALELQHPDDWRVVWYRGIASLASGDNENAALSFDAVYDAFPGEAAPKLALAVCAEVLGQLDNAAEYYRLVWATDPSYVSAAFGLARVQLAAGDRPGAVRTLESVPEASIHYTAARVAAVRARLRRRAAQDALTDDLTAAAAQVEALESFGLDAVRREQLSTEVLGTALDWVLSGRHGARPAQTALLGSQLDERGLRFGLERSYRVLARLAQRGEERIDLVERANRFRPRTWV